MHIDAYFIVYAQNLSIPSNCMDSYMQKAFFIQLKMPWVYGVLKLLLLYLRNFGWNDTSIGRFPFLLDKVKGWCILPVDALIQLR